MLAFSAALILSATAPHALQAPTIETDTSVQAVYGDAAALDYDCLVSGSPVTGSGRRQYCIDVPGGGVGQQLVVDVQTTRSNQILTIGGSTYITPASSSNFSSVGPIIEIKPFQQSCTSCDYCPCIGCGHRCECSCNAQCRLRKETSCSHTAGVLRPGRWYVGVDAPASFTLRATLVGALALRSGETLQPRTLFSVGAPQRLRDEGASEGGASTDYFFFDPAVHERLKLHVSLLRTGSPAAALDVYVRFGEAWPTTEEYDARMSCDALGSPHATFVLQPDRLLNERLGVMVVARGDSWATYSVTAHTAPSTKLMLALGLVGVVALIAIGAIGFARRHTAKHGIGLP